MSTYSSKEKLNQIMALLKRLWKDEEDRILLASTLRGLDGRYGLIKKIADEPGVEEIIKQMFGRLADSFAHLSDLQGKRILDIACGSSTSKAPESLYVTTRFGAAKFASDREGYTAQFEPWLCRILFELGADAVGIDFGDLDHELFTHYHVDLGQPGALDFLPGASFDAVQDSRLFGSPEFAAQFPERDDRLRVAAEIQRQERRLLKPGGIVIHSDAEALLR